MSILNLTRKILPMMSKISTQNKASTLAMPEMVLFKKMRECDKIVHVGMNECKAVRMLPNKIDTIFTDGLAGCNSIGVVAKGKDGNPIVILSHYTPLQTSQINQANAIDKQLQVYGAYFDSATKPKVYYNVPGYIDEGELKPCVNNVIEKIKAVLDKHLKKGFEEKTILYQNRERPAFFSSANIFQFDPANLTQGKMTTVGEKEFFINLNS